ncbi:MAG: hypothetical protein JXA78_05885 [Anaerolineales bacterium]|nr:hypothetical protein [Anaerolineales bacterium]
MKFNPKSIFLAFFAVAFGLIVLLGYFVDLLAGLRELLLQWAVILAGFALLVGVANLVQVHLHKVSAGQQGSLYSIVLLVSLFLALLIAGFSPTGAGSLFIYNYIQVPIEASLMALLAIILAYSAARLFYRRFNVFTLIFMGTALFVMIGSASFPLFDLPILRGLRDWIVQVWATAGARGILLGVALGIIATGIRILMGVDRPYGG